MQTVPARPPRESRPREDKSWDTTLPHGTLSGYLNWKCSCGACKGYWAARALLDKDRNDKAMATAVAAREVLRGLPDTDVLVPGVTLEQVHGFVETGVWAGRPSSLRRVFKQAGMSI
jgi:hypothetical protein